MHRNYKIYEYEKYEYGIKESKNNIRNEENCTGLEYDVYNLNNFLINEKRQKAMKIKFFQQMLRMSWAKYVMNEEVQRNYCYQSKIWVTDN